MRPALDVATLRGVLRCLIVDDSESFVDAATLLLEREGLDVVGVASTAADALRAKRAGSTSPPAWRRRMAT
jgi:hypothetical protein